MWGSNVPIWLYLTVGTIVVWAGCTNTIYIMPFYVETTVTGEYAHIRNLLDRCSNKTMEFGYFTKFVFLSVVDSKPMGECTVGGPNSGEEECAKLNETIKDTTEENRWFIMTGGSRYNLVDFMQTLPTDCLEYSMLLIPTNIRCIHKDKYPDFDEFINDTENAMMDFVGTYKFPTYILWINYNYLSPTDNIGCELDHYLKPKGSPMNIQTSEKNGMYFADNEALDLCIKLRAVPSGLQWWHILVVVVAALCLIMALICIVLCVLKVKYHYAVLKMDFLFRRKPKSDEELQANNYYSMNTGYNGDQWELNPGELDVDYEKTLGSGAFAYVVQGTLLGQRAGAPSRGLGMFNGNLVAVKILHSSTDALARENFVREITLMKSFDAHPHLVNLVGCLSDPDATMLVTELCEKGDLREILVRHRPHDMLEDRPVCEVPDVVCLRLKDLTSFSWQVADGLCYLSSHSYVHRDVAARNVFITRAMNAKLGDFGLCNSIDPLSSLHTTPHGKIPIKWTAPEALRHNTFSEKSDIWSYGVFLFEMFSGAAMPYPTLEADEVEEAIFNGVRPDIPEDAPENIADIMKGCWKENVDERPTFDEIRSRLTGLLDVCSQAYGYIQFAQQNPNADETENAENKECTEPEVPNENGDVRPSVVP